VRLKRKGGTSIEMEVSPQIILDKGSGEKVVFGIASKVSDRVRNIKEEKRRLSLNRLLSTHEMTYPATSIGGLCWYLEDELREHIASEKKSINAYVKSDERKIKLRTLLDKENKDWNDKLDDIKKLTELIELMYESTEMVAMEPWELSWEYEPTLLYKDVIIPVAKMIHRAKFRRGITIDYGDGLKSLEQVYVDKSRFRMVFFNLLINAAKYCVLPCPDSSWSADILVRVITPKATHFSIHIMNYGIPIEEWEKEKIFEFEYRTGPASGMDAAGKGLGLYISKKIISHFEGKLYCSRGRNPVVMSIDLPRKLFSSGWYS
jgi:signal transduction histidine kinase